MFVILALHPKSKITGAKATVLAAESSSTHGTIANLLIKN